MPDRKIAVIAVHGVGHHEPGESARAIADLLGNPPPDAALQGCYRPFRENHLRLPAPPLETAEEALPEGKDVGYNFMWRQLHEYKGMPPEDIYETIELRSRRRQAGVEDAEVDVYELFWSDLSQLGTGFVAVFGELYQILFHLARLGAHTVDAARRVLSAHRRSAAVAWQVYYFTEFLASMALTVAIPISNLVLLPLLLIAAGAIWQEHSEIGGYITAALIGIAMMLVVYGALIAIKNRWPERIKPALLMALPLNGVLLWSAWLTHGWPPDQLVAGSMTVAYLIAGVVVYLTIDIYSRYRPEIKVWGPIVAGALTIAPIAFILHPTGSLSSLQWALRCAEAADELIRLSWLAFYACFLLAWLAGIWAWLAARRSGPAPERSNWTARLTLALPGMLFMLVTVGMWYAIVALISPRIPPITYVAWNGVMHPIPDYIRTIVVSGTVRMFPVMIGFLVVGLFLGLVGLAPVVTADVKPPEGTGSQRRTEGMGIWLNTGFLLLRFAGELIYLGMFLTALLGVAFALKLDPAAHIPFLRSILQEYNATRILGWLGGVFGGSAATLFALRGKLEKAALGLRTVLNVALDVDNYLRDDPADDTPRARICARFASLLRHVAAQPYDKIVIIAHSQGTVITADLLRFLRIDQTALNGTLEALRGRNIELFTMGCPLGQLYGLRFPYLYSWARDDANPPGAAQATALGVRQWVNSYRSGDYVGRSLWSPFDPRVRFALNREPIDEHRRERCIGQGAHTHYWDSHGGTIAGILDGLIG